MRRENTQLFTLRSTVMRFSCCTFTAALIVVVPLAAAQDEVLHEFVPDLQDSEATIVASEGPVPAAIVYRGEILPAPTGGALELDERAMTAVPGSGVQGEEPGRRSPTFRPDRITQLESTQDYYTVFTPSIAPFKRVTALDGVVLDGTVPVLGVWRDALEAVAVESASAAATDGRDRFWGSVVLDFSDGSTVPLPSVAPSARILNVRTEPTTAIRIVRDGADNFFVTAVGARPSRPVRLIYLTDAPQSYFNPALIPDVPTESLAAHAAPLPAAVARDAHRFARELGLRRRDPLPRVLSRLVEYFRSFDESDEFPEERAGIYLDLARAQRGVCRHRVYAFVITALGLGLPARFVMNEAHAWVEVALPEQGWARIDLGGAAAGLEAHNEDGRPRYQPVHPDPFPRPEAYERSYSQALRRNGTRAGAEPASPHRASEGRPREGRASGAPRVEEAAHDTGAPIRATEQPEMAYVRLDRRDFEVFRGRMIDISGRVEESTGEGLEGLRVEVLLADERERLLGVTVTNSTGEFRGSFGVPPDLSVGDYRLVVRTPGDDRHAPSEAR